MTELTTLATALGTALVTVFLALPAVKKKVLAELHHRLDKISGGRIASLEDLVEEATAEKRLRRETPIAVYGGGRLWNELRHGGFQGAMPAESPIDPARYEVAVVDYNSVPADQVAKLHEPYLLIYKEDGRYDGPSPPGAQVTYANSSITLDARLMETLRHRQARKPGAKVTGPAL